MSDPSLDPERRIAMAKAGQESGTSITAALYSLKEDASFAHKRALEGDLSGLVPLQRAWSVLERAIMAADRKTPEIATLPHVETR